MSKIIQVPSEDDLNKITALSGSGPAYFFLFIEAMRNAAKEMGFDDQMASDMALGTCLGAAVLASNSTTDVSILREQVTSKGGTTERALAVFNEQGLEDIMKKATKAALDRAVELGQRY
jgi:pyrroline-5-carboxylate reductase